MRFRALALDYDGTIAENGTLNPHVRSAIAEARSRGVTVVIVTGRILDELRRVAGDLDFVDAVVAENGAVMQLSNGYSRILSHPPDPAFLDELRRRKIEFATGTCIVEADATWAPQTLAVIQEMELPLVLIFNRGRLMILPQAVSKSTGLREVLRALRLSPHNTIGIGDGENDHDLLAACEVGVAVAWGSLALQHAADQVLPGDGPSAVAEFIRRLSVDAAPSAEPSPRSRIILGTFDGGEPLTISAEDGNLLVVGKPGSGKSWVTGLMCERLILRGYCACVIDPKGDHRSLESLPGVVAFGDDSAPRDPIDVVQALRHSDISVLINLSAMSDRNRVTYLSALLPKLADLRRRIGLPHRVVADAADCFLHKSNIRKLVDLDLNAYALAADSLSELRPRLLDSMEAIVIKCIDRPEDYRALAAITRGACDESEWRRLIGELRHDEALFLAPHHTDAKVRRFQLSPRLTAHVDRKLRHSVAHPSA